MMTVDTNSMEFQKAVAKAVADQVAEEVSKLKGIGNMGYKATMNTSDIREYHKFLKQKVSLKDISAALLIQEDTLKEFTPEIVKKFAARKQAQLNEAMKMGSTIKASEAVKGSIPTPNLTKQQEAKQKSDKAA